MRVEVNSECAGVAGARGSWILIHPFRTGRQSVTYMGKERLVAILYY